MQIANHLDLSTIDSWALVNGRLNPNHIRGQRRVHLTQQLPAYRKRLLELWRDLLSSKKVYIRKSDIEIEREAHLELYNLLLEGRELQRRARDCGFNLKMSHSCYYSGVGDSVIFEDCIFIQGKYFPKTLFLENMQHGIMMNIDVVDGIQNARTTMIIVLDIVREGESVEETRNHLFRRGIPRINEVTLPAPQPDVRQVLARHGYQFSEGDLEFALSTDI